MATDTRDRHKRMHVVGPEERPLPEQEIKAGSRAGALIPEVWATPIGLLEAPTPELIEAIKGHVTTATLLPTAAEICGIPRSVHAAWMAKGRLAMYAVMVQGRAFNETKQPFVEYCRTLTAAAALKQSQAEREQFIEQPDKWLAKADREQWGDPRHAVSVEEFVDAQVSGETPDILPGESVEELETVYTLLRDVGALESVVTGSIPSIVDADAEPSVG